MKPYEVFPIKELSKKNQEQAIANALVLIDLYNEALEGNYITFEPNIFTLNPVEENEIELDRALEYIKSQSEQRLNGFIACCENLELLFFKNGAFFFQVDNMEDLFKTTS